MKSQFFNTNPSSCQQHSRKRKRNNVTASHPLPLPWGKFMQKNKCEEQNLLEQEREQRLREREREQRLRERELLTYERDQIFFLLSLILLTVDNHPENTPGWLHYLEHNKRLLETQIDHRKNSNDNCENLKEALKILNEDLAIVRKQRHALVRVREIKDHHLLTLDVDHLSHSLFEETRNNLESLKKDLMSISDILDEYEPRTQNSKEIFGEMIDLVMIKYTPKDEKRKAVEPDHYVTFRDFFSKNQYGLPGSGPGRSGREIDSYCREY